MRKYIYIVCKYRAITLNFNRLKTDWICIKKIFHDNFGVNSCGKISLRIQPGLNNRGIFSVFGITVETQEVIMIRTIDVIFWCLSFPFLQKRHRNTLYQVRPLLWRYVTRRLNCYSWSLSANQKPSFSIRRILIDR